MRRDDRPLTRIPLATGVELDVAIAGDPANPPILLLHGFPESHFSWRHIIADLARDHHVIAPDQRGYAGSSRPERVENYTTDKLIADIFALADALRIDRFTLVGHDWGGAIAWGAALMRPDRVARLVILNAPHPLIFQRTLIEDEGQRRASRYITRFRSTRIDRWPRPVLLLLRALFWPFADADRREQLRLVTLPGALTTMLNWYRALSFVLPEQGGSFTPPPFPRIAVPTLVIWGMKDPYLMPVQLDGLDAQVADLTLVRIEDGGHFIPSEKPAQVIAALRAWLARAPSMAGTNRMRSPAPAEAGPQGRK